MTTPHPQPDKLAWPVRLAWLVTQAWPARLACLGLLEWPVRLACLGLLEWLVKAVRRPAVRAEQQLVQAALPQVAQLVQAALLRLEQVELALKAALPQVARPVRQALLADSNILPRRMKTGLGGEFVAGAGFFAA